jgi:RNA polymerase sigma-70 factor (family 1)
LAAYSTYSDQELLKLLTQGDQDAFDVLFTRHWETLYKAAFYVLRDPEACKDILQDIFIWLWQHRQTLQIQSLPAYLRVAVKFRVANYIHSGKIREGFYNQLAQVVAFSSSPSSEELSEIKELNTIIQNAVAALPDKCRQIYLMKREELLSNQEIADKLGISVKTVENQMTIALRRVRSSIDQYLIMLLVFSFAALLS